MQRHITILTTETGISISEELLDDDNGGVETHINLDADDNTHIEALEYALEQLRSIRLKGEKHGEKEDQH
jgi:hypothetical protein